MGISKMIWKKEEIKKQINLSLPERLVVPRHSDKGHFYEIDLAKEREAFQYRKMTDSEKKRQLSIIINPTYPSVTGKLQILKDESLINYKMNRAIEYVFANWKSFSDESVMEHLDKASRVSSDILTDAGDIGTEVHEARERYFRDWIKDDKRPEADILTYIPPEKEDIRAISALRALVKFVNDYGYEPIASELLVYDHQLRVAGTLDDIGLIWSEIRPGAKDCIHDWMIDNDAGIKRCLKCDAKYKRQLVLMDLKTSNQFKDHYFFQVALYYWMFKQLTGVVPERCFIIKLSKEDGNYKVEDLYRHSTLASYARSMVRTHSGIEFIKELRRNNQKTVLKI
jgi:hypothetical protein